MHSDPDTSRGGEYASRGEYHRHLDAHWDYRPTYLAKMALVRAYLESLPADTRVLDAGCGEGVLVEEFADRLRIEGVDLNYSSARVRLGSLTALPFEAGSFDRVLCLDVLEHLPFEEQVTAIAELSRVLRADGETLISVPNLAHLQSRVHFLLGGRLIRTAAIAKHPGDRPVGEYLELFRRAGFAVSRRRGVFPTVPVVTAAIRRNPVSLAWLHRLLSAALPIPGWCFLNLVWLRKAL
jgi:SAM-dependent methyltransferase